MHIQISTSNGVQVELSLLKGSEELIIDYPYPLGRDILKKDTPLHGIFMPRLSPAGGRGAPSTRAEVWAAARAGEETVARVPRLRQQQIEVTNFDFNTIYDGILFVECCY